MTDKKDPHAELMRLADRFATTRPGGLAVARRDALDAYARTLTDRITELEAQLEAVGAEGVGAMLPRHAQPAPAVVGPVAIGFSPMWLAPIEGTPVLLYMPTTNEKFVVGQWHGSPNSLHGNWGDDEGNYYGHDPIAWMNLSVLERLATTPPQPQQVAEPASHAVKDVLAERQRQINVEGWTPKHDDEHDSGQLAGAAACYARHINARSWVVADLDEGLEVYRTEPAQDYWPWDESWWKPTTPRRDAVKACALLLAEIERIDRATTPKEPS